MTFLTENIMDYRVAAGEGAAVAGRWLETPAPEGRCSLAACLNPHSVVVARGNEPFRLALQSADLLLPDGVGIVWASRLQGGKIRTRVTGSDLFREVCEFFSRRGGGSFFFLGSSPPVLRRIAERLAREYPAIQVAGVLSPPYQESFSPAQEDAMVEAVNASGARVLWVGMTAPKQELWLSRNAGRLKIPHAAAVGAVFDFYAGTVRRSRPFWQKLGLEWLPRLLREPRRLWRRNLISTPLFLWRLFCWRLRRGNPRRN